MFVLVQLAFKLYHSLILDDTALIYFWSCSEGCWHIVQLSFTGNNLWLFLFLFSVIVDCCSEACWHIVQLRFTGQYLRFVLFLFSVIVECETARAPTAIWAEMALNTDIIWVHIFILALYASGELMVITVDYLFWTRGVVFLLPTRHWSRS